jgi:hypothetical protein
MNQTIIIILVIIVCVSVSISIGIGIFFASKPKPTNAETTNTPNPNSYYIDENNIKTSILPSSLPLNLKNAKEVYIYNFNKQMKVDGIYTFQGKSKDISFEVPNSFTIADGLFTGTISLI